MKRTLFAIPIALLLLALCLTACAEGTEPATYTSSDYEYTLLDDGTAEITGYNGNDKNLTIPDQLDGHPVAAIGDSAFSFCSSLTSVSIPDSVTEIGANPFSYCDNLTKIIVSPDHPSLAVIDGVLFSKPDKRLICYPAGKQGTAYQIPSGIQIIGEDAFYECSSLTSVSIPDSVTAIGDDAFSFCSSLASASIPDSVAAIGNSAFSFCSSLTSVSIPDSVTAIGNSAFSFCSSLSSVSIPDSVTAIGVNPFILCEKLTKIIVSPDHPSLAVIDGVLFSKPDKRLVCYPAGKQGTAYQIPSGIQIIGDAAFYGCSSLTSVSIPDSVTTIGDEAFSSCYNLTSVSIPDSVTAIGYGAFSRCSSLTLTVGRDSYALQYCKENGLNYTYPDSLDWLNN